MSRDTSVHGAGPAGAGPARLGRRLRPARLSAAILALAVAVPAGSAATPLRRVLLLSCDTLAASHVGAYGGGASTACLDSLAASGVLFRHCLTPQVWTLTAHASLLTGLTPGALRVGTTRPIPAKVPVLAERLAAAGLVTGGFPTHNAWLDTTYGFARGFGAWRSFALAQPSVPWIATWFSNRIDASGPGRRKEPYFVFVHHMDVHSVEPRQPFPYWPADWARQASLRAQLGSLPARRLLRAAEAVHTDLGHGVDQWDLDAYDPASLRRAYASCAEVWDAGRLGRLLGALAASGHLDDTLVIVTADHGEEFGEHGGRSHRQPYAETREVPLVLIWPGRLPRGLVVEQPVWLPDVVPTVLDFARLAPPVLSRGVSLRPLLTRPAGVMPDRDFLIDGHHRGYRLEASALVGRCEGRWWSLVADVDTSGCAGTFAPERVAGVRGLFDLGADPGERHDVAAANPAVVADLRRRMAAQYVEEARLAALVAGAEPDVELSEDQKRRLRALGY